LTVHHGALAYLLGINALRVVEACRGQRTYGALILRPKSEKSVDGRDVYRMVLRIAKIAITESAGALGRHFRGVARSSDGPVRGTPVLVT
jgi:hypothetical protein